MSQRNGFAHPMSRHIRAFTLVELLVVIAIIGILVSLLLPAVNSARAAARTTQCKNNIRQLALAMINFESARGHFPTSQVASGADEGSGCAGGFYSWQARILPYIEEDQLYSSIDFTIDLATQCNDGEDGLIDETHPHARIAEQIVDAFLCPSDGFSGNNIDVMGINTAPDNYVANAGWPSLSTGITGGRQTPARYNGIVNVINPRSRNRFQPRSPVRAKHIKDGLSKTACVSERLIQRGLNPEAILSGSTKTLSYHITERARTLGDMAERCTPANTHADLVNSAYIGRSWLSGWAVTAPTYMHVKQPNTNHCHFSHSTVTGDFIVTPTSNHTGGVNVAFADGHVRFVEDSVDERVWWAMGSRNGGDSINEG